MGWIPWSGSKSSDPKPPVRQDRQRCWDSRDLYFTCLDTSGVLKPGDEGKACSKQLKDYENSCAKSWIDYFNQRRVLAEQQKESLVMANAQADEARRKGR
ncbi:cytochrome oxidase c subunit VIb-domain-containing protein [Phellopilus nigrolimitatus]|nr:cytochrome oxidase c subunit VIb-domain-containing protein [Phellopilus nigrolimitatus]